ncbi:MAG: imidazoleglycerol-phosphate dehydratase [Ignisphaera sp.]|nr:imidazoleglycerol-phosphate dehydratase [Ignisphaera sp.]MCX8167437.1 imidazoleglycerol-phosphate dehydratase [Ignisphaera sp.]MDW8084699.1 imidazoleglycerol-phosphate dehydratase [Ignisphaera sp.]
MSKSRTCRRVRETLETRVEVELNIDEAGEVKVVTPVRFLDHLLETMLIYMNSTATVTVINKKPFDDHHTVEDCAIVLGETLAECLGNKIGIKRFADAIIPMDEALVLVSIDISGRGKAYVDLNLGRELLGDMATENIYHFIETLAYKSATTIHVIQLRGFNAHHIAESTFKGLGITMHEASRIVSPHIRSTKGVL